MLFVTSRTQMVESRMKPLWIAYYSCDVNLKNFSQCPISSPRGYSSCGQFRDILVVDCGKEWN